MILTFYDSELQGAGQYGPAYYIPDDSVPVSLRIHAAKTPTVDDATFEIYSDGVSIMSNRYPYTVTQTVPPVQSGTNTTVILPKDQSSEEDAENFNSVGIAGGSWVTCKVVNNGGGSGFTLQLELE